ncbi:MAG: hypothetical protein AB7L09_10145 [Nitrospira sp.]
MDTRISTEDTQPHQSSHVTQSENEPAQKKPFVRPILTRHATLPKVTAAFFGTFSPGNRPQ